MTSLMDDVWSRKEKGTLQERTGLPFKVYGWKARMRPGSEVAAAGVNAEGDRGAGAQSVEESASHKTTAEISCVLRKIDSQIKARAEYAIPLRLWDSVRFVFPLPADMRNV